MEALISRARARIAGSCRMRRISAVGALGAADVQIDFSHTSYSVLEQAPFLLVMVIGVVLLGVTDRRWMVRLDRPMRLSWAPQKIWSPKCSTMMDGHPARCLERFATRPVYRLLVPVRGKSEHVCEELSSVSRSRCLQNLSPEMRN